MDHAAIVDENQTNITRKRHPWRHSKIHIAVPHKWDMVELFFGYYCATFIYGVALWVYIFLWNKPEGWEGGIMGLSHVMAIC
ncbi:unnamed protein product [Eruca vesicaria subsp. sativa]|uniref:Uncharacterized protein n=1 Tax=Eruca vesicaria subsp. sativa TaxID=29727 RepID=A0ABC8L5U9_ERUVS|nr:unnamed protein product [Eruca vesicaria subsp. sativa]